MSNETNVDRARRVLREFHYSPYSLEHHIAAALDAAEARVRAQGAPYLSALAVLIDDAGGEVIIPRRHLDESDDLDEPEVIVAEDGHDVVFRLRPKGGEGRS